MLIFYLSICVSEWFYTASASKPSHRARHSLIDWKKLQNRNALTNRRHELFCCMTRAKCKHCSNINTFEHATYKLHWCTNDESMRFLGGIAGHSVAKIHTELRACPFLKHCVCIGHSDLSRRLELKTVFGFIYGLINFWCSTLNPSA